MNEDEKPRPPPPPVTPAEDLMPQSAVMAPQAKEPMAFGEDASQQPSAEPGAPRPAAGPADVQSYIGRQLRAVFDDVAKQPVPQRFLDLMQQIEERTSGR